MKDTFRVSDLAENTDKGLDKFNGDNENIIQKENKKLMKLWIGKNADKILNINMNIAVLFLGELYFFYRKMYIEGIIILILKVITFMFIPYKYLIIIFNMILFFITNSIYKSHILRKINKIKHRYSSSKLEIECKKRGGTNILLFVLLLIIELLSLSYYIYNNTNISKVIPTRKTTVSKHKSESQSTSKEKTFDGKLEIVPLEANVLDFGFPSYWTMDKSKAYYNFDKSKKDAYCRVELGIVKNYTDANKLAKQFRKFYQINDMTITTNNTIKWYIVKRINDGIMIHAFTQKDKNVIVYKFTIEKNAPEEKCKNIEKEIFKLIKPMGYTESIVLDERYLIEE